MRNIQDVFCALYLRVCRLDKLEIILAAIYKMLHIVPTYVRTSNWVKIFQCETDHASTTHARVIIGTIIFHAFYCFNKCYDYNIVFIEAFDKTQIVIAVFIALSVFYMIIFYVAIGSIIYVTFIRTAPNICQTG